MSFLLMFTGIRGSSSLSWNAHGQLAINIFWRAENDQKAFWQEGVIKFHLII